MEASTRRWLGLIAIALGVALIVVDTTIVNVIVPSIVRDLDVTSVQTQWIQESYAIVFARIAAVGRPGGRHRRRPASLHHRRGPVRDNQPAGRVGAQRRDVGARTLPAGRRRGPDPADIAVTAERLVHRQSARAGLRRLGFHHRCRHRAGSAARWIVVRTRFLALGFRHQHPAGDRDLRGRVRLHRPLATHQRPSRRYRCGAVDSSVWACWPSGSSRAGRTAGASPSSRSTSSACPGRAGRHRSPSRSASLRWR